MRGEINIDKFSNWKDPLEKNKLGELPFRLILTYTNEEEEKIKEMKIPGRRVLFLKEEELHDLDPEHSERLWERWLKHIAGGKGLGKISLEIELGGGDPSRSYGLLDENKLKDLLDKELKKAEGLEKSSVENLKESSVEILNTIHEDYDYFLKCSIRGALMYESPCDWCKGFSLWNLREVLSNLTQKIKEEISARFPFGQGGSEEGQEGSKSGSKELKGSKELEIGNEGKEARIRIYRHRRYDEFLSDKLSLKEGKLEKGKDIFLTLSGAMLSFNLVKENLSSEKGQYKLMEWALYRVMFCEERLIKEVLSQEGVLEGWRWAGLDLCLPYVGSGGSKQLILDVEGGKVKQNLASLVLKDTGEIELEGFDPPPDIFFLHIGLFEKLAEGINQKDRLQELQNRFCEALIEKGVSHIYFVSGRGRIGVDLPPQAKFVPFSQLSALLYKKELDKLSLINSLSYS